MKVYAEFIEVEKSIYRRKTLLHFGTSTEIIGSAILMNPGQSSPVRNEKLDRSIIQEFYSKNHNLEENTENWHVASIDSTMRQLTKIFNGSYLGYNTELDGIIQLFNCFYFKDQNLSNALNNFDENSEFIFKEMHLLKEKPVYFGWGKEGKSGKLKNIATNIFNSYNHSLSSVYRKEFTENGFYHPRYINYSFKNSYHVREFIKSFFESIIGKKINFNNQNNDPILKHQIVAIELVNEKLKHFDFELRKYKEKNHLFNATFRGKNDILDFRINIKDGYFAFRSLNKIKNSFFELAGKDIYKDLFSENAEIEKHNWLVYKSFLNYNTTQSLEEHIAGDLKKLLSNIQ